VIVVMALVSGHRSTLNPNAPVFIPTVYRQVEDFSPEWWQLVTSSTWFRDFWLSQHPEGTFGGSCDDVDVVDMLPDEFDTGVDDETSNVEAWFEELVMLAEAEQKDESIDPGAKRERQALTGLAIDVKDMLVKDLAVIKSPKEWSPRSSIAAAKYQVKPPHFATAKCSSTRRIHQPR